MIAKAFVIANYYNVLELLQMVNFLSSLESSNELVPTSSAYQLHPKNRYLEAK